MGKVQQAKNNVSKMAKKVVELESVNKKIAKTTKPLKSGKPNKKALENITTNETFSVKKVNGATFKKNEKAPTLKNDQADVSNKNNVIAKTTKPLKSGKPNKKSLENITTNSKYTVKKLNEDAFKKNKKAPALKNDQADVSNKNKKKFGKPLQQKIWKNPMKKVAPKFKKEVKVQKPLKKKFESISVDDSTFDAIVSEKNITKIADALKKQVEIEVSKQKTSIFGDYKYCLNVSCFKIPSSPKRMVKLNLKHSLVDIETDDIVLVVADLKRGAKIEYESTIEHYNELLREAGIEKVKIMPFSQLRNEYKSFEEKRKLASTYDYYLVDGRISGNVAGFCGSTFQKPRTTFHTVRMEKPQALKNEILKALRRTAYKDFSKGDLITIPIGNDKFIASQVAENVMHVVSQLKKIYPGGIDNIRGLDIKINIKGTSALPIYANTSNGPEEQPFVVGPREQHLLKFKKHTNEVLSKFNLTKDGDIQKLTKDQIERRRKLKEAHALLLNEKNKKNEATEPVFGEEEGKEEIQEDENEIEIESDDDAEKISIKKFKKADKRKKNGVESEDADKEVTSAKNPKKAAKGKQNRVAKIKKVQKPIKNKSK